MNNFEPKKLISTLVFLVVVIGAGLGIYNYFTVYKSKQKPTIEITKPKSDIEVTDTNFTVEGTVSKGSTVKVNGQNVTVDSKSFFSKKIELVEGINIITFEATAKNGQVARGERKVKRIIPIAANSAPKTTTQQNQAVKGSLSDTGPENMWLPEASLLAAAGTAWFASRSKIKKSLTK